MCCEPHGSDLPVIGYCPDCDGPIDENGDSTEICGYSAEDACPTCGCAPCDVCAVCAQGQRIKTDHIFNLPKWTWEGKVIKRKSHYSPMVRQHSCKVTIG